MIFSLFVLIGLQIYFSVRYSWHFLCGTIIVGISIYLLMKLKLPYKILLSSLMPIVVFHLIGFYFYRNIRFEF